MKDLVTLASSEAEAVQLVLRYQIKTGAVSAAEGSFSLGTAGLSAGAMATSSDLTPGTEASANPAVHEIQAGVPDGNNTESGEIPLKRTLKDTRAADGWLTHEHSAIAEAAARTKANAKNGDTQKRLRGLLGHLEFYTRDSGSSFAFGGTATGAAAAAAGEATGSVAARGDAGFVGRREEKCSTFTVAAGERSARGKMYATAAGSKAPVAPLKRKLVPETGEARIAAADWKRAAFSVAAASARSSVRGARATTAIDATANAAAGNRLAKTTIASAAVAGTSAAAQDTAAISPEGDNLARAADATETEEQQWLHACIVGETAGTTSSHNGTPHVRCDCVSSCTQSSIETTAETEQNEITGNAGVLPCTGCGCCADADNYEGFFSLQCHAHPLLSQHTCRLQHSRRQGPLQEQMYCRCEDIIMRQQAKPRRDLTFFHPLLLNTPRRWWFSAASLHQGKFAVYVAALVLAFTCGSMYGKYTTRSASCPLHGSFCPVSTANAAQDDFDIPADRKSAPVEGAAVVAKGGGRTATTNEEAKLMGHVEAAAAKGLEETVAADKPATATYTRKDATRDREEKGTEVTPGTEGAAAVGVRRARGVAGDGAGEDRRGNAAAAVIVATRKDSEDIKKTRGADKRISKECGNADKMRDIRALPSTSSSSADTTGRSNARKRHQRGNDTMERNNTRPSLVPVDGTTSRSSNIRRNAAVAPASVEPTGSAAVAAVQTRRLQDTEHPASEQKPDKINGEFPRVRGEPPEGGAPPRDEVYKKRFEAKIKKRLAATAAGPAPTNGTTAAPEKKKDSASNKRSSTDKKRQSSSRQEGPLAAHSPARQHRPPHLRLLDPHIFRKELCPFLRTGDAQLKSWFTLLVLYIAEWPAYAYTGNGGKRFIDQLRYYAENFRSPLRATEHGKKLFEDELACGTNEVFKEGLVALKDRIHNFGDLTRVLKHLAKTERDFADLLDYTQYSKLPARAAVTGFALLLRTAFEGMVFSFCKSVFLRKGFKGNFNRKELYSNVVWLYHRTQTQYWMLLLVGKIIKQIASGRPHTGIVILRSEETPRFRAVGDSSSLGYGGGSKGQMLEVLYGVGAYSALQRIVSGTIRKKVGWALSRFEELASEKGDVSSPKAVLQPHVFVTGYYGKTSRGTEVREGLFGSEVEADALEEMMEDLPAGHVLLQISLVDEWIFRDPMDWTRIRKSEADVLTAYTAVQMLRAELSWDPSLGSLGAFSVAYTSVTDLYSRQRTTTEERRYDPDVHVLLIDDASRFVQTASEEGCRSRILSIVSEDPLQLRRSVPANRISIRGTAKLLPSGELFRKGSFGMGLSLELQRSAEKLLRSGHVMIHVFVRGLNRRSPDTDDLDFTASELVSRLLQRSEGYYDIPVVKTVTPITSQSLLPRGVVTNCAHTVPEWIVILSSCGVGLFFLLIIIMLLYHGKVKLPWWVRCLCSSSSPWSVEEELPARDSSIEILREYSKRHRSTFSRSLGLRQEQESAGTESRGAASTPGEEAAAAPESAAEEEGGEDAGTAGDAEVERKEAAALEPSAASKTGSREGEEPRGWVSAAAKWMGDRTVPTLSQLPMNHFLSGDVKGEKKNQEQQDNLGSEAEEEAADEANNGILYANTRSPSQQLQALGSASTCASACGYTELHPSRSMASSEWQVPSSPASTSALLLQHQQQKQSLFSHSHSEWDHHKVHESFEGKIDGLRTSGAQAFCARAPYSPFPYLTSCTYSYSELSAAAAATQQHAAPFASVQPPDQNETHSASTGEPAENVFQPNDACEGDTLYGKTQPKGEQKRQGTYGETPSLPRSYSEKEVCLGACAAELLPREYPVEGCPVSTSRQLHREESMHTSNNEMRDTASKVLTQGDSSASNGAAPRPNTQTGGVPFPLAEDNSHGSISDESHELDEFA